MKITVVVNVEPCDDMDINLSSQSITNSVREAISNAISDAEYNGHKHPLSDSIAILLIDVGEPIPCK